MLTGFASQTGDMQHNSCQGGTSIVYICIYCRHIYIYFLPGWCINGNFISCHGGIIEAFFSGGTGIFSLAVPSFFVVVVARRGGRASVHFWGWFFSRGGRVFFSSSLSPLFCVFAVVARRGGAGRRAFAFWRRFGYGWAMRGAGVFSLTDPLFFGWRWRG